MQMRTQLVVAGEFPGYHRWPEAPAPFQYLRLYHSHMFTFRAYIAVVDDREFEFLELADRCSRKLQDYLTFHGDSSCESLAQELCRFLQSWQLRVASGEVLEDGKCGAIVYVE